MTTRRSVLAGVPGVLALTSGCAGVLDGSDALTFEAATARTEASVASEANYELDGVENLTIEREFAGQTATAINRVATYEKSLSIPLVGSARLGVFAAIATPAIEIAGETFNPVGDYDNDQLVQLLQSNYEGISNAQEVSSQTVAVLGTDTSVTKFRATADFNGQDVDVNIHVTKVRNGADFVACFGVYPRRLDEQENVLSMMRAMQHPVESSS
jgi:hypothetical protein